MGRAWDGENLSGHTEMNTLYHGTVLMNWGWMRGHSLRGCSLSGQKEWRPLQWTKGIHSSLICLCWVNWLKEDWAALDERIINVSEGTGRARRWWGVINDLYIPPVDQDLCGFTWQLTSLNQPRKFINVDFSEHFNTPRIDVFLWFHSDNVCWHTSGKSETIQTVHRQHNSLIVNVFTKFIIPVRRY